MEMHENGSSSVSQRSHESSSNGLTNLAEAAGARKRINSLSRKDSNVIDEEAGNHALEEKIHLQPQSESMAFKCGSIAVLAAITLFTCPPTFTTKEPTVLHVWYYGWLSAVSTGLGAIPLMFWGGLSDWWLGVCNAVAAGMMLSASYNLVVEGCALDGDGASLLGIAIPIMLRVVLGVLLGMGFVVVSKRYLEEHEDLKLADIGGMEATKMVLIVGVMTLHSFAEGLGIGVSFCGNKGAHLGLVISASLAVHNVPEGLAVALVLIPRGVPKFQTLLWSICTSLPQPLIAAPVFLFVEAFIAWEPLGLGFAAGAMLWVCCSELITDALKEVSQATVAAVVAMSFATMSVVAYCIDNISP
eukprot:CAMPEP_0196723574 /NCGR_PEP_ID=MMETSP1091-20130531/5671_1 /TAXON_ID=302021 /ORGANISM="Rhodomonas sp., Strain CCMP768" /LENGTH=357 /DNA_ID=CAMNT_0042065529 /DNA_START=159 /DNA_END=1232 /DNA_ORIENTATION=-